MRLALLFTLLIATPALAKKKNEAYYRDRWASQHNGRTEVRMGDRTRCDVLTATHAIEVDWAHKWQEAVGQSLWYSFQTNKRPGIVLILRSQKDYRHLLRLQSLIDGKQLNIKVWPIHAYAKKLSI